MAAARGPQRTTLKRNRLQKWTQEIAADANVNFGKHHSLFKQPITRTASGLLEGKPEKVRIGTFGCQQTPDERWEQERAGTWQEGGWRGEARMQKTERTRWQTDSTRTAGSRQDTRGLH